MVSDRQQLLEQLQRKIHRLEGVRTPEDDVLLSTGCPALDAILPQRGWRRGTVVEWLSPGSGSGASFLALLAARHALRDGGALVICDQAGIFYPLVLQGLGIDMAQVILVRPKDAADQRWALDQALRSPAVALAWARLDRLDDKTSRRFQLAAESGGALGMLVRPDSVRGKPTWAEVQLAVQPLAGGAGRQWQVECVRARGPTGTSRPVIVEWDEMTGALRSTSQHHETHSLPVASRLARATGA